MAVWHEREGWQPVTAPEFKRGGLRGERFAVYVWRSERHGGGTKSDKSRRTLALPQHCVYPLREQWKQQAEDRLRAGDLWQDNGLVFASEVGTPLTVSNVIRAFRRITVDAGSLIGSSSRHRAHIELIPFPSR